MLTRKQKRAWRKKALEIKKIYREFGKIVTYREALRIALSHAIYWGKND